MQIDIAFQPKQAKLYKLMLESPATWLGIGGARGGGKSGAARNIFVHRYLSRPKSKPTVGMIFRRTYPELLDNHIEPMWRQFPGLQSGYNKGEKILTLPSGSQIAFRYAEKASDIDQFLGKEYLDIFVDQAEALTGEELIKLKTSCRWPGGEKCNFVLGFNPGGRGSAFLRRIFKERRYLPGESPSDYDFIQAYGWDNIEWVRAWLEKNQLTHKDYYSKWDDEQRKQCFLQHSDYGRSMLALPPGLQAGWLYGDFENFAGQYFENFSVDRNVVDPRRMVWRPWFKRWVAVDWGYAHNAVALWFTQAYMLPEGANSVDGELGEPVIYCYRELVRNRTGSREVAATIANMSDGEEIDAIYVDSGAKSQTDSGDTPYDEMNRVFRERGLPQAGLANKDRIGGWRLLYEQLGQPEDRPKLVISKACERTIGTIPLMSHDRVRIEDCEKFDCNERGEGGDDAADCLRYGLLSRLRTPQKPKEQEIQERLAKIGDMTERAMADRVMRSRPMGKIRAVRPRYSRRAW